MAADLGLTPAGELAALIRSRDLSGRELLEHYLDRVDALNPHLNAVVTLDAEGELTAPPSRCSARLHTLGRARTDRLRADRHRQRRDDDDRANGRRRHADGSVRPEPRMDVGNVARAVLYVASLPLGANVASMTVMATQTPFVGRG